MFPITLDTSRLKIVLAGYDTPVLRRRLRLLDEAAPTGLRVFVPDAGEALQEAAGERLVRRLPEAADLNSVDVLMVADVSEAEAARLYEQGRAAGALVNVEDVLPYCDFHYTGTVRRGDLLFTVSTGGKSPALARILRQWLEQRFPAHWAEAVTQLGRLRLGWKQQGKNPGEITRETESWLRQQGLLEQEEATG